MTKISTAVDTLLVTGNLVIRQTAAQREVGVISVLQGDREIILSQQDVAAILPELKSFVWRRP